MELKDIFKRLGYPKHTGAVYDVLGQTKEPLLVAIIAMRARVSRVVVYRCLKRLIQDGLARTVFIGRRKFYVIENPRRLNLLMRMLESKVEKSLEKYAIKREKEVPQDIRFLYGPSGIRSAFDDVIAHTPKGGTFYRYTSERDLARVNQYLAHDYRKRRDKKRLERLVISNAISGKQKKSSLDRFIKFIPSEVDQFEQNIIQLIYNDRMAIIDLAKEQVVIIENKQLCDFQKVIFRLLYKRL